MKTIYLQRWQKKDGVFQSHQCRHQSLMVIFIFPSTRYWYHWLLFEAHSEICIFIGSTSAQYVCRLIASCLWIGFVLFGLSNNASWWIKESEIFAKVTRVSTQKKGVCLRFFIPTFDTKLCHLREKCTLHLLLTPNQGRQRHNRRSTVNSQTLHNNKKKSGYHRECNTGRRNNHCHDVKRDVGLKLQIHTRP